jgi:protein-S-isoprenylcysteine O-methyltransferase Ste14
MLTRALALMAYLVGIAGAGILFGYVVGTGAGFFPPRDTLRGPLPWLINIGLLFAFALQHSGMARQTFKTFLVRWIPADLERSIYVAASGTAVTLLVFFWQPLPGKPIWQGPTWIIAISLLAALGIGWCCGKFDHATFFGLTYNGDVCGPLRIEGPYRYVRHPLMLGLLIALWAQPIMPPELLLLNIGLTIYILIAIWLEERDLVREFGMAYEEYRRKVPALIPLRVFF